MAARESRPERQGEMMQEDGLGQGLVRPRGREGVRLSGALARASSCRLRLGQPSCLWLRDEMALHLRLAKDASFLNGLSEPGQQVLLRLAFPELNKHKDILSSHALALSSR
jgi:hypothetical protein